MREAKNPWVGVNFIPDNARMEVPPAFFLKRIHDFDNMLVVIPSRLRPFAYVMARRRQFGIGLTDKALESTITQPDTLMCLHYGVVPVCLMYKHGSVWNPDTIIQTLKARDLWAHGGADKVADMLEEQEEAERQKIRADIRDDLWNRSGDAWRSYQARTGQRVSNPGPARPGAAQLNSSPSSSTVGSGIVLASR